MKQGADEVVSVVMVPFKIINTLINKYTDTTENEPDVSYFA